jgi:hypothetical protein
MLFACSAIPIPSVTTSRLDVTRFVTSACLVKEFDGKRNRDDKLRVCAASSCALHFALFTQANCDHSMLMYYFYHSTRLKCALLMIRSWMGSWDYMIMILL